MKKTLQIKNYPVKEMQRLSIACIKKNCNYVDIIVPAVTNYLKEKEIKN